MTCSWRLCEVLNILIEKLGVLLLGLVWYTSSLLGCQGRPLSHYFETSFSGTLKENLEIGDGDELGLPLILLGFCLLFLLFFLCFLFIFRLLGLFFSLLFFIL